MRKLTAVTIFFRGRNHTRFFFLIQNRNGKGAILPENVLNAWLDQLRVQHGQTYSIG